VPQKHSFNAGLWKQLEARELRNYALRYGEIWIVAGPVFGERIHRTSTGLPIPEKLFKIIVCIRGGKAHALAFLMDQNAEGRIGRYLCSIDQIEELTGLDFLPKFTPEQQSALEARPARRAW
jgi:endonuclease G